MASPARMDTLDDTVMIEEQIDTGLKALLDSYRPAFPLNAERKDELNKQFTLFPARPIPEFNHAYAQAFEAQDAQNPQRAVYAMVLDNTLPYRQLALNEIRSVNNPYAATLLGFGTVHCSHLGEARTVLFIERPQGTPISDFMRAQGQIHGQRVRELVLQPAVRGLLTMRERKVSHGNIGPNAFFIGENPMLGECYSAPCGTLTHYLYEPPERIGADPLGRGEANEKTDSFALGVLTYELIYGLERLRAMNREDYMRQTLENGTYNTFAGTREFPDMFQDFFRGTLADNPNERWGLDQLTQWLDGKRFNMIASATSSAKEASRAFDFLGEHFFSRRLLAHVFQRNWRETVKEIKHLRLDRWCEMSLHRPEMAERMERAMRVAGDASTERHVNDMMTRVISILDPTGPIRGVTLSVRPDGIGPMLANLLQDNNPTELNYLLGFIETDISNYWSDLDPFNKAYDHAQILWKLQRIRPYLKSRAFGFGLERVLYDLNPSLPCQSDLLRQYHITNATDALKALDAMAANLAPDTSFMDRHLASFVASKIDMGKEIRLLDLATIPALADNPELVIMKILAKAQQKNDRLVLVGLAGWAAMRIEKMLDEIHNRVTRRELKQQLKKLASTGSLNDVLSAVVNREIALRDHEGFAKAIALHQINHQKIERFRNPKLIDRQADDLGGKLASTISNAILGVTFFIVLSNILGI